MTNHMHHEHQAAATHHAPEAAAMHHAHEDVATHGMLLFGEQTPYLSHLPMFASKHNFQAIFEVSLSTEGTDPMAVYREAREARPEFKMYSFVPTEQFFLTELVTPVDSRDAHSPPLRSSFLGEIYRGHFETFHIHEKPESRPPSPLPRLENVAAQVTNVVIFRELDSYALAPPLPRIPQLTYFLFGKARESFLAHAITQPPDFDQVLGVQVDGHQFTDEELRRGLLVTFPERANSEDQRIKEQEQVTGQVLVPGPNGPQSLPVQFRAGTQFYFETDDLAS